MAQSEGRLRRMMDTKRVFELEATPERIEVYTRCSESGEDGNCTGCPYRYKCEDVFPTDTPWGTFTIPTDFALVDGHFIIEQE